MRGERESGREGERGGRERAEGRVRERGEREESKRMVKVRERDCKRYNIITHVYIHVHTIFVCHLQV